MFIRKKRNQSGSSSVQIVDKSGGKYRVIHTVGASKNPVEIERLLKQAHAKLDSILHGKQLRLFPSLSSSDEIIKDFLGALGNGSIRTVGPELIFGTLFDGSDLMRFLRSCFVSLLSHD